MESPTKSRYGRTRKPKISQDFCNIDDLFVSASSKQRALQNEILNNTPVEVEDIFKNAPKQIQPLEFVEIVQEEEKRSPEKCLKVRKFFKTTVEERTSSKSTLLDPIDDLEMEIDKVLKIVATKSDIIPAVATQKHLIKTYQNKRKQVVGKPAVESFGLPDEPIIPDESIITVKPNEDIDLEIKDTSLEVTLPEPNLIADSVKDVSTKSNINEIEANLSTSTMNNNLSPNPVQKRGKKDNFNDDFEKRFLYGFNNTPEKLEHKENAKTPKNMQKSLKNMIQTPEEIVNSSPKLRENPSKDRNKEKIVKKIGKKRCSRSTKHFIHVELPMKKKDALKIVEKIGEKRYSRSTKHVVHIELPPNNKYSKNLLETATPKIITSTPIPKAKKAKSPIKMIKGLNKSMDKLSPKIGKRVSGKQQKLQESCKNIVICSNKEIPNERRSLRISRIEPIEEITNERRSLLNIEIDPITIIQNERRSSHITKQSEEINKIDVESPKKIFKRNGKSINVDTSKDSNKCVVLMEQLSQDIMNKSLNGSFDTREFTFDNTGSDSSQVDPLFMESEQLEPQEMNSQNSEESTFDEIEEIIPGAIDGEISKSKIIFIDCSEISGSNEENTTTLLEKEKSLEPMKRRKSPRKAIVKKDPHPNKLVEIASISQISTNLEDISTITKEIASISTNKAISPQLSPDMMNKSSFEEMLSVSSDSSLSKPKIPFKKSDKMILETNDENKTTLLERGKSLEALKRRTSPRKEIIKKDSNPNKLVDITPISQISTNLEDITTNLDKIPLISTLEVIAPISTNKVIAPQLSPDILNKSSFKPTEEILLKASDVGLSNSKIAYKESDQIICATNQENKTTLLEKDKSLKPIKRRTSPRKEIVKKDSIPNKLVEIAPISQIPTNLEDVTTITTNVDEIPLISTLEVIAPIATMEEIAIISINEINAPHLSPDMINKSSVEKTEEILLKASDDVLSDSKMYYKESDKIVCATNEENNKTLVEKDKSLEPIKRRTSPRKEIVKKDSNPNKLVEIAPISQIATNLEDITTMNTNLDQIPLISTLEVIAPIATKEVIAPISINEVIAPQLSPDMMNKSSFEANEDILLKASDVLSDSKMHYKESDKIICATNEENKTTHLEKDKSLEPIKRRTSPRKEIIKKDSNPNKLVEIAPISQIATSLADITTITTKLDHSSTKIISPISTKEEIAPISTTLVDNKNIAILQFSKIIPTNVASGFSNDTPKKKYKPRVYNNTFVRRSQRNSLPEASSLNDVSHTRLNKSTDLQSNTEIKVNKTNNIKTYAKSKSPNKAQEINKSSKLNLDTIDLPKKIPAKKENKNFQILSVIPKAPIIDRPEYIKILYTDPIPGFKKLHTNIPKIKEPPNFVQANQKSSKILPKSPIAKIIKIKRNKIPSKSKSIITPIEKSAQIIEESPLETIDLTSEEDLNSSLNNSFINPTESTSAKKIIKSPVKKTLQEEMFLKKQKTLKNVTKIIVLKIPPKSKPTITQTEESEIIIEESPLKTVDLINDDCNKSLDDSLKNINESSSEKKIIKTSPIISNQNVLKDIRSPANKPLQEEILLENQKTLKVVSTSDEDLNKSSDNSLKKPEESTSPIRSNKNILRNIKSFTKKTLQEENLLENQETLKCVSTSDEDLNKSLDNSLRNPKESTSPICLNKDILTNIKSPTKKTLQEENLLKNQETLKCVSKIIVDKTPPKSKPTITLREKSSKIIAESPLDTSDEDLNKLFDNSLKNLKESTSAKKIIKTSSIISNKTKLKAIKSPAKESLQEEILLEDQKTLKVDTISDEDLNKSLDNSLKNTKQSITKKLMIKTSPIINNDMLNEDELFKKHNKLKVEKTVNIRPLRSNSFGSLNSPIDTAIKLIGSPKNELFKTPDLNESIKLKGIKRKNRSKTDVGKLYKKPKIDSDSSSDENIPLLVLRKSLVGNVDESARSDESIEVKKEKIDKLGDIMDDVEFIKKATAQVELKQEEIKLSPNKIKNRIERSKSLHTPKFIQIEKKLVEKVLPKSEIDEDALIFKKGHPGQLLWARLGTHPYWPCMVTKDPHEQLIKKRYISKGSTWMYHVRFFGDTGRRAWVNEKMLLIFNNEDDIDRLYKKYESVQKSHIKLSMYYISKSNRLKWEEGVSEAQLLKDKTIPQRFDFFFFMFASKKEILEREANEGVSPNKQQIQDLIKKSAKKTPLIKNKRAIRSSSVTSLDDDVPLAKFIHSNSVRISKNSLRNLQETIKKSEPKPIKTRIRTLSSDTDSSSKWSFKTSTTCTNQTQDLLYKRNNLFKGISKERVCQICFKSGGVFRCKGKCLGYFHAECAKHLARDDKQVEIILIKSKKSLNKAIELNEDEKFKSLSLIEQLDFKLNEVMEPISALKTIYADSTTDSNSEDSITDKASSSCSSGVNLGQSLDEMQIHVAADNTVKLSSVLYDEGKCKDCNEDKEAKCFACGCEVSWNDSVVKQCCTMSGCGKAFHPECMKMWPQTQFNLVAKSLVCPAHVCHICVSDDPRGSISTRCSNDKMVRCLKCPATYHSSNHCIPAGTEILSTTQMLCPRHLTADKKKLQTTINTNWCFICSEGGDLICCETCPTCVHATCSSINLMPDGTFMCEDCESGRFPLYDEIVWVKLGAYRWWPALILFPNDIPETVKNYAHNKGEFVVKFYGTYDHYWVARGRCFIFQEGDNGQSTSVRKLDHVFLEAIQQATEAHALKQAYKDNKEAIIKAQLKPPPYQKIKVNRPIGNVKQFDLNVSNATPCNCDPNAELPCGPDSDCINRLLMTECDPEVCQAGTRCTNQLFEKRDYPPLQPYKTKARGWGLKSTSPLIKNQFIIEYVGDVIDPEEYQRRIANMHALKEDNFYFLTIDGDRMIDAGPRGNVARFMNHCCQPNCETQKWNVKGDTRVGLFASHDIEANVELTFNYNLACIGEDKQICRCGAPNCSGFIGAKVKTIQDEKKSRKAKNKSKKKRSSTPTIIVPIIEPCFICGKKTGNVIHCNNKICPKYYHLTCLKITSFQEGKWICPWHTCNLCTKRTIRCCVKCTDSYCPLHSEGLIRFDKLLGYVCSLHDKSINEPKKQHYAKTRITKLQSIEAEVTSTTSDEIETHTTKLIKDSLKSTKSASENEESDSSQKQIIVKRKRGRKMINKLTQSANLDQHVPPQKEVILSTLREKRKRSIGDDVSNDNPAKRQCDEKESDVSFRTENKPINIT